MYVGVGLYMQCICACVCVYVCVHTCTKHLVSEEGLFFFILPFPKRQSLSPLNFIIYKDSRLLEIKVLPKHGVLKYSHIIYSKCDCFNIRRSRNQVSFFVLDTIVNKTGKNQYTSIKLGIQRWKIYWKLSRCNCVINLINTFF